MLEILTVDPCFVQNLHDKYYKHADADSYLSLTREEYNFIQDCGEITIGIFPNVYPYSDVDRNGNAIGILPDMMDLIAQKTGFRFRYDILETEETALDYLENNPNNLIAGVYPDNKFFIEDSYTLSNKLIDGNIVFICRNGENYKINDNQSHTVAVPEIELHLRNTLAENYPAYQALIYPTTEDCLQAIKSGSADFVMQDASILSNVMQNPRYKDLEIITTVVIDEPRSVVGNAGENNNKIISIVDKCIATISTSEIEKISLTHSTANTYSPTFGDMIYQYRYAITTIILFITVAVTVMTVLQKMKKQHYMAIQETNAQLALAAEESRKASKAKSDFLSRISHDIRTPMNGILGIAYLAKEKDDAVELREDMEQIETSGKMLLSLINDTLDISHIESGKMELHPTICDEERLMKSAMASAGPLISEKNIKFKYEKINMARRTIYADEQRLLQIFINLLTNAVKFTPEGGDISVTLECLQATDDKVLDRFSIRDNGIGMSREFQKNLFTPFAQENKINTDSRVGTGLGLSIVKSIVDLMKGSIEINSEENIGTEIIITMELPIAKTSDKIQNTDINIEMLKGMRVLLCEDHDLNAKIASRLLEGVGVLVERAENGKIGLHMLQNKTEGYYNAILMDVRMPEMGGYETTRQIRSLNSDYAKTIPIIALTANAFREDVKKSRSVGMNDYLSKPIEPRKLYETLYKYLRERN